MARRRWVRRRYGRKGERRSVTRQRVREEDDGIAIANELSAGRTFAVSSWFVVHCTFTQRSLTGQLVLLCLDSNVRSLMSLSKSNTFCCCCCWLLAVVNASSPHSPHVRACPTQTLPCRHHDAHLHDYSCLFTLDCLLQLTPTTLTLPVSLSPASAHPSPCLSLSSTRCGMITSSSSTRTRSSPKSNDTHTLQHTQ